MNIVYLQQSTLLYWLHITAENFEYIGLYNTARAVDRLDLCRDAQAAKAGTFSPTPRDIVGVFPVSYSKMNSFPSRDIEKLLTLNKEGGPKW